LGVVTPHPISFYARQLRPSLSPQVFEPVPSRVIWFVLHCAIIAAGTLAIAHDVGGIPGRLVCSLLIGHSFAGLAFVAHEALHGSVVKGARSIHLLGFACFLPFTVSPTLWTAWHNKVHHGHTMAEGIDPDAFPTLREYRGSRLLRIADRYALGRGHWAGALPLFVGFTVQTLQILLNTSRNPRFLTVRQRRRALWETAAGIAFWVGLGVWLGPVHFLFAYGIPLLVGNAVVTTYILTNHSLSALTNEANDPLLNSLTVLVPKPLAKLHLDFGLHVEHHLFPSMSPRHATHVRALLQERWPERYQSMSLWKALGRLISTPRIYLDETTLVDPKTGRTFPTLAAQRPALARAGNEQLRISYSH
jgi:fatty acid desaturase